MDKNEQTNFLAEVGLPNVPYTLDDYQVDAITRIKAEEGQLLCWATGCGKTLPAAAVIGYWKMQGKKTLFLVPLKSLNAEHGDTMRKMGFNVAMAYGDERKDTAFFESSDWDEADVLICTFETLDSILSSSHKCELVMERIGAMVVDEIHGMGDAGRGDRLEYVLTTIAVTYPEVIVYGLSATIGNPEQFAQWLGVRLSLVTTRPVPLTKEYITYQEIMYSWNEEIPDQKANYRIRMDHTLDIIREHIGINPNANFLVFTTSRERSLQTANDIAREIFGARHFYREENVVDMVEETPVGFHTAGLDKDQRAVVESAFRSGQVKVVCATPTLAQGVNLPADVCIIFDVEQYDGLSGSSIIDANRLQQTIGRAGRRGLSAHGYAYIIAPERLEQEIRVRAENALVIESNLRPRLHEKILRWTASGIANSLVDLCEYATATFARITRDECVKAIEWLVNFGFLKLELETETFTPTWFGLETTRFYLTPETVIEWRTQADCITNATNWKEVFARFASVEEYSGIVVVREEDKAKIDIAKRELGHYFPAESKCQSLCLTCAKRSNSPDRRAELIATGANANEACEYANLSIKTCDDFAPRQQREYDKRLLKTYVLTFADDLVDKYDIYKKDYRGAYKTDARGNKIRDLILSWGDKNKLEEAGERFFSAAAVIFNRNVALKKTLKDLSVMASSGCMDQTQAMIRRIKGMGPVRAKKTVEGGITTIGDFINADVDRLARIVGVSPRIARDLQENARNVD